MNGPIFVGRCDWLIVHAYTTAGDTLFTGWGHNQCRRQVTGDWYVHLAMFPGLPCFQFLIISGDGMAGDVANMQC